MQQGGIGGEGRGIAHDALGNSYVAGVVNAPALFDQDTTASHFADAFIAKYDAEGNVLWVRTGGDDLIDRASDIAVDEVGNAYITGQITTNDVNPSVTFDGSILTGLGSSDLFVAKYDPAGALLWIRQGGGALADEGRGIHLSGDGVVVSGFFQGTAVFGGDTLTSAGLGDVVVLKYDTNGELIWSTSAGGPGDEQAGKLVALPNGGAAVVGKFQQTATFGSTSITANGLSNIFLARFDPSGVPVWAKKAGSDLDFAGDAAFDIDRAANGDLVICGEIAGLAAFEGTELPTNGSLDVFIARYDEAGNLLWVHHGGGPQQDHAYGVAVDDEGNAYLTGQADDGATTAFDTITLAPFGNEAVFLAKYDPAGAVQWVRRYAPGLGGAVEVLDNDCLYFTGGASGIVGQPAFDAIPWQYVDRAIFTARFCAAEVMGIQEMNTTSIKVFPVPAADMLNVELSGPLGRDTALWLVDPSGRAVKAIVPRSERTTIDVSSIPSGSYQLVCSTASGTMVRNVTVVH